jgi:transposase-like protein
MGRPGYPAEFRHKALDLLAEGRSVASVAHDLDISDQTLYNCRRQDRIDRRQRQPPAVEADDQLVDALRAPLPLRTLCGSKLASRSRGTCRSSAPSSVASFFGV